MIRPVANPPNPFLRYSVEWLDTPPQASLEVYEEDAKSILSENDSPDVGFRFSLNPYRGCFHACAYCYARRTHQYLDFGAGSDFDSKIVVKTNAAKLLEKEFDSRRWVGDRVVFSGVTDCYQPLEASYEITRACLEVCNRYRNPVGIITKGALVRRDIDLLQQLARDSSAWVAMSIAFVDDEISKKIEPHTPRPSTRFRVLEELSRSGIRTGLALAPVIPGINDTDIPQLLESARDAGARFAFMTLLRLPGEVEAVFLERLQTAFPERAKKVRNSIADMKQGKLNQSSFGSRMRGTGARWEALEWLFENTCEQLSLNDPLPAEDRALSAFRRPSRQLSLFP